MRAPGSRDPRTARKDLSRNPVRESSSTARTPAIGLLHLLPQRTYFPESETKGGRLVCAGCAPGIPHSVVGIGKSISVLGTTCSGCQEHYCRWCGHRLGLLRSGGGGRTVRCPACSAKNQFSGTSTVWVDVHPPRTLG